MSRQGLVADHSGATARPGEAFATHPCAVDGEGLVGFSRRSNSKFSGLEAFANVNTSLRGAATASSSSRWQARKCAKSERMELVTRTWMAFARRPFAGAVGSTWTQ